MRVVKPNQIGVLTRPYDHRNTYFLCVTGLILFPFAEPRYPMAESSLWVLAGKELGASVLDESMPKRCGEVLLRANAYAPGGDPQPVLRAAVELEGKLLKEVAVVGDRVWRGGVPTDPAPFVAKSITWDGAFGGPAFKRNPLGKGHRAKDGAALPNIENPRRLLRSPRQLRDPVGLGPYPLHWPQRMRRAGKYDDKWLEKLYPGLAENVDWALFNVAPLDQQIPGFFRGDEELVVHNMHPDEPRLTCKLPGVQLRCVIERKTKSGDVVSADVAMALDTVWLVPHARHGILVFHGVTRVREDDASDVALLYMACEDLGRPRSPEHYGEELDRRRSREHGAVASLDDRPLMPALRGTMKRPPAPYDADAELVAVEQLAYKNLRRKGERQVQRARDVLVAHGLDPDEHGPSHAEPFDATGPLDDVLARAEKLEKHLQAQRREMEEAMVRAEQELRVLCERAGIDFDEIRKEWRGPHVGGPPKPVAEEQIGRMRALKADGAAAGFDTREIDEYLDDPAFVDRLHERDRATLEAYRTGAQDLSPAATRDEAESRRLRVEVELARRRGESLKGKDLTGANLAGIDLSGADLEEALLEGCNLAQANLTGAKLRHAVLVRANVKGARFDGADLERANLSQCACAGASFVDCRLTDALLIGVKFVAVTLDRADLQRASLLQATIERCSARGVRAVGTMFDQLDLSDTSFAGADLRDAVFMRCRLDRADFTAAQLGSATLFACKAERALFAQVDASNLRVVEATELVQCDFRGAKLIAAGLRGAKLAGCDFSDAQMPSADLSDCDLAGCRLHHAVLRRSLLMRANLTRATLTGADLFEALLARAVLHGADLRGANLYQADVAMIQGDTQTRFEDAMMVRARVRPFFSDKVQEID